jgi:hypothetical protein
MGFNGTEPVSTCLSEKRGKITVTKYSTGINVGGVIQEGQAE